MLCRAMCAVVVLVERGVCILVVCSGVPVRGGQPHRGTGVLLPGVRVGPGGER